MPDLHSLPAGSWPEKAIRNNGPDKLTFERYKLRELAEGWPCYRYAIPALPCSCPLIIAALANVIFRRDACEWENLLSIFHPDAYIYTTWTGRTHHKDFVEVSKAGMDKGAFIMHRVHGSTTDINPEGTRAVTKMKATITQRFNIHGCDVDAESDCRFCFFFQKESASQSGEPGKWLARFVRHWYEKDKLIPVDPRKIPHIDDNKLNRFPVGYRYLAYCQEETMNVKIMLDMPGHRREGSSPCGKKHDTLYMQCKDWVEGRNVDI
jgi:hypothetical protein